MHRIGIIHNIELLTKYLASDENISNRDYFISLINIEKSNLALLDAREHGASEHELYSTEYDSPFAYECLKNAERDCENSLFPCVIIDPRPGLLIVAVNSAAAMLSRKTQGELIGCRFCEVTVENAATLNAGGVSNMYACLASVMSSGNGICISNQRFDLGDSGASYEKHHWNVELSPILDSKRDVLYIRCDMYSVT